MAQTQFTNAIFGDEDVLPVVMAEGVKPAVNVIANDLPTTVIIPAFSKVPLLVGDNTLDDINNSSVLLSAWLNKTIRLTVDGQIVTAFPPLTTGTVDVEAPAAPTTSTVSSGSGSGSSPAAGVSTEVTQASPWLVKIQDANGNAIATVTPLGALKVDGSGVVQPVVFSGVASVAGTLLNDNGPPTNLNLGVLPAIATAAAPAYTEGNQVGLSLTLGGALRVDMSGLVEDVNIAKFGGTPVTLGQQLMAASIPVTIASDQAEIGKIRFALPDVDAMSEAILDFNTTGDVTVIAGVGGQTIRVYRMFFVLDASSNITFKDETPTSFTGVMPLTAGAAMLLDLQGEPWFTTAADKGFVISQSGTAQISGRIYYTQS